VIVYGCASAETVPNEDGASLYQIPASGILLTSDPKRDGWFNSNYFYVSPDGTRIPLKDLDRDAQGLGVSRREAVAWYEGPLDAPVMRSNRSADRYFIGDSSDREESHVRSNAQLKRAQDLVKTSCPPAAQQGVSGLLGIGRRTSRPQHVMGGGPDSSRISGFDVARECAGP
jgi:hypothetical protein